MIMKIMRYSEINNHRFFQQTLLGQIANKSKVKAHNQNWLKQNSKSFHFKDQHNLN